MVPAANLDLKNCELLLADGVQFFKMAAIHHSGFVWGCIWTTHKEYLVVAVSVQNLIAINEVVLIICKFQYLTYFAGKHLIMPKKLFFFGGGI